MLWFLLACADTTPAWAVQHASVVPTESGLTGTQTWEFFNAGWTPENDDQGYICARVQTLDGTLTTSPTCPDCRAAYELTVSELDSDCDSGTKKDAAFAGPALYAIGDVAGDFAADDPYPDQSFGWSVGFGEGGLTDVGYAYAEALGEGDTSAPGWANDRAYTLWPAIAWQL